MRWFIVIRSMSPNATPTMGHGFGQLGVVDWCVCNSFTSASPMINGVFGARAVCYRQSPRCRLGTVLQPDNRTTRRGPRGLPDLSRFMLGLALLVLFTSVGGFRILRLTVIAPEWAPSIWG